MMKTIIVLLLTCVTALAQQTVNNYTVKTNLTFGQILTAGSTPLTAAEVAYLDGTTNGIQSQINRMFQIPSGSATLYTLGDSIANGASSSTFSQSWPALFAAANGWTEQRLAYGSGRIIDYYWQSQPPFIYTNGFAGNVATAPSSITGTQIWAVGMGDYNGMRDYGTTANYQAFSKAGFLSLGVALAVTNKSLASAATASGSWTANTNLGGFVTATSSTATLTFTNIVGDTVYVAYIVTATNDFGSVSIAVNGTNYGTFSATGGYGNRTWDNGTDANIPTYISPAGNGKLWYMPRVVRIPLGMSSKHTVVVTATGASVSTPSGVLWVAGNGQRRTIQNTGPIVLFSGTLRQVTYSGSGSDLAAGQFAGNIRDVVDTLRGDGLAVYYVPSEQWFNEFTEMSGDNVHPNNAGHATIATAFQDVYSTLYNPRTATGRAGFLPSGISIGRSPALSGDLRFPQGSSIVWRNSGAFDGVSITNSGTALEIDAPNSTGSLIRTYLWRGDAFPMKSESYATFSAGSPIGSQQTVAFGMSSSDAILNQSVVTENNTGTGGFIVHDTALTRLASGSGSSDVYRVQVGGRNVFRVTAGGRLLVDTATAGTSTTSRFGTGANASSGIILSYGSNALDRELGIGDGVIDSRVNTTGAAAALGLNPTGGNVIFGALGTTNTSMEWTGIGSGTDRRLRLNGNSIQGTLNSAPGTTANISIQALGGNTIIGSGTAGVGLQVSSSGTVMSKIRHGTAALVGGTGTVADANVTANTRIFLTSQADGGTPGWVRVSARSAGVSFTITSSSGTDTSTVGYMMIEP